MPNYYDKTTFERKDIAQETINLWVETSNPKLGEYELTPPQPTPDATWGPGYWIIPAPATYTANAWLEKEGYGPTQLVTLLDLTAQLQTAGKVSPKLDAVKLWTNMILAEYVQSDTPKEDWGNPPFSFSETVTEAFNILNG
jgi:uncharacterized protein (DUF3820 family)